MGAREAARKVNLVLADSSFWIALRNTKDVNHGLAKLLAKTLLNERARLVVTPLIFAEVHARLSRARALREQVVRDIWENPIVHMEQVSPADQRGALELLRQNHDKDYPFCDATSFVVMARLAIGRALSFDDHFRQYGKFVVLP